MGEPATQWLPVPLIPSPARAAVTTAPVTAPRLRAPSPAASPLPPPLSAPPSASGRAPARSSTSLLHAAWRGLAEAASAGTPNERYSLAHLAALRAAAAVLAARARPEQRRRGRPVSAWNLLVVVAPALREWASFFAAGASKRAAAEAGLPVITIREADDLLRDAERFLSHVEDLLHQSSQPPLHAVADHRAIRPAGSRSS
ncbi:MAG: SAV_6107 family HEPN domain-containing protein [Frankiaceae bacterium]